MIRRQAQTPQGARLIGEVAGRSAPGTPRCTARVAVPGVSGLPTHGDSPTLTPIGRGHHPGVRPHRLQFDVRKVLFENLTDIFRCSRRLASDRYRWRHQGRFGQNHRCDERHHHPRRGRPRCTPGRRRRSSNRERLHHAPEPAAPDRCGLHLDRPRRRRGAHRDAPARCRGAWW